MYGKTKTRDKTHGFEQSNTLIPAFSGFVLRGCGKSQRRPNNKITSHEPINW